jgi:flagellar hook assembly protein FlgD
LALQRPDQTRLFANYPNPFNPETWIPYQLAAGSKVELVIYDVKGVVVRHLELGHQPAGYYTQRNRAAYWDGRNAVGERVASGIYFYQLRADNVSLLRKMVILK